MKITKVDYLFLFALAAFYLCFGLGAYGVLDNNEGLYAEMAREMVQTANYAVPHLNGVPYLEKPPLLVWLLTAVYRIFGQSELASRSISVASALVLLAAIVQFGRCNAREGPGWLAALILASSVPYVVISRTLFPDPLLTTLFSLAMLTFYCWHRTGKKTRLVLSYGLLALSILAKGFLALVLAPVIVATFALVSRRTWTLRDLLYPPAVALLLLVVAPWHVWLALKDGQFAWFYVVNEHILRYLDLREPKDYYTGPVWYYVPRIVLYLLPWSLALPLFFVGRSRERTPPDELQAFLWIWFLAVLLFFSLSQAKGNYYLVLGMPPLALLLATRLDQLIIADQWRPLLAVAAVITVIGILGTQLGATPWMKHPSGIWIMVKMRLESVRFSMLFFSGATASGALLFAMRRYRDAIYSLALSSVILLLLFLGTIERAEPFVSTRLLVQDLQVRHPSASVFLYRDYERLSSLPYYLKRPVSIVDSKSNDLLFGQSYAPPAGRFLSESEFRALCDKEDVVILVHRYRIKEFLAQFGQKDFQRQGRIGNVIVFVNRYGCTNSRVLAANSA